MNEIPHTAAPEFHDGTPLGFTELRDSGLLWLINTAVLHPRGYAMALADDEEGEAYGWSIVGDGTEPWQFGCDEGSQDRLDECFAAIKALLP